MTAIISVKFFEEILTILFDFGVGKSNGENVCVVFLSCQEIGRREFLLHSLISWINFGISFISIFSSPCKIEAGDGFGSAYDF